MKKIFLLDDEVQVREGIKNSIDWKKEGFIYCGDASDGEIALPLVEKYQPEIVITDIKMPFMDGLEFSRIIREKMPAVKIIILSGHDEFEYAREAMRVQITEYCLKPISANELLKILHKVSHQIDQERLAKNHLTELQNLASQSKSITKETFLNDLCQGIYSPSEAINKATHLGIDLVSSYYYILIIEAKDTYEIDSINWVTEQYSCLHFKQNPKEIVFIMKGESKGRLEHEARLLREKILAIREQNIESPLIFGFGKVQSRIQGIAVSFLEAEEEKNYHKIIHKHKQIDNDQDVSANHEVFLSNRNELIEFLKNGDCGSITDFSNRYTLFLQEGNNTAPFFIYYSLLDFTITIKQYIKETGMEDPVLLQEINTIEMRAGWIREYSEVNRYITEMLQTVFKSAIQSGGSYSPVIHKAMDYIQSHFHDTQLSLQSIANRVNVSPSYFSHMFSQETGQTLVEYITNIRMEHAKRLLKSTNEKTYEIAQKVGYNDSHYFCNLFKKLTGMTTRQFKLRG
jgi:two-component system, response regulator YesN